MKCFFDDENPVIYISVVLPDVEVMGNYLLSSCIWNQKLEFCSSVSLDHGIST